MAVLSRWRSSGWWLAASAAVAIAAAASMWSWRRPEVTVTTNIVGDTIVSTVSKQIGSHASLGITMRWHYAIRDGQVVVYSSGDPQCEESRHPDLPTALGDCERFSRAMAQVIIDPP